MASDAPEVIVKKSLLIFYASLLVFSTLFPSISLAKIELADGKFVTGGHGRFRYEYKNNSADFSSAAGANDTLDFGLIRLRPYFEYNPHDEVSLYIEPQFTAGFGESGASFTSTNAAIAAATTASGSTDDATLGLHQGYLVYSPADFVEMKLGRQELLYGDQIILSPLGWHNNGRSFDALKFHFSYAAEKGWIDVITSLLSDAESGQPRSGFGTVPSGDAWLLGLYNSYNFGKFFEAADLYALYRLDNTNRPRPHNYVTFGLRIKAKPNRWDYRFEVSGQIGRIARGAATVNQREYQADLEGGHTFAGDKNFRVGLEGQIASKDFNAMFPLSHGWLGYMDIFGRRNISSGVLHLSLDPADKWNLKLDAHTFLRTSTSDGLFTIAQSQGVQTAATTYAAATSNSRLAGEEIDLVAGFVPIQPLKFEGGVSVFVPLGFIRDDVGSDLATFAYLQTVVSF